MVRIDTSRACRSSLRASTSASSSLAICRQLLPPCSVGRFSWASLTSSLRILLLLSLGASQHGATYASAGFDVKPALRPDPVLAVEDHLHAGLGIEVHPYIAVDLAVVTGSYMHGLVGRMTWSTAWLLWVLGDLDLDLDIPSVVLPRELHVEVAGLVGVLAQEMMSDSLCALGRLAVTDQRVASRTGTPDDELMVHGVHRSSRRTRVPSIAR